MKTIFTFSLLLLTILCVGQQQSTSVYNHMTQINSEWFKQTPSEKLLQTVQFETDVDRIQLHLQLVEQNLRNKSTTHLTTQQEVARKQSLSTLNAYWKAGQFPVNTRHQERRPYFIDDFGTACAVGYLMQESGFDALAEKISTADNYIYIHDLADQPEVLAWANNQGFSLDELAWIQPAYAPLPTYDWNTIGNDNGYTGAVKKMLTSPDGSELFLAGTFDSMDGQISNCGGIAVWDGTNWSKLGNGIHDIVSTFGVINDIEFFNGELYLAGEMTTGGAPVSIPVFAKWDGQQWVSITLPFTSGAINDLQTFECRLYLGGDFTSLDYGHLAAYDGTDFSHSATNCLGTPPAPEDLKVNGPVYTMRQINDQLAIGGEFSETNDTYVAVNFAMWEGRFWTYRSTSNNSTVYSIGYDSYNNILIAAGKGLDFNNYSTLNLTNFNWSHSQLGTLGDLSDDRIYEFIPYQNTEFVLGNFNRYSFSGDAQHVSSIFFETHFGRPDNTVTAGAIFQNQLYMAGDFLNISGISNSGTINQPVNRLARTDFTISNNDLVEEIPAKIFYADKSLNVIAEQLDNDAELLLYDMSGKLIDQVQVLGNKSQQRFGLEYLKRGAYVYQLRNQNIQQSGKFIVD